MARNLRALGLAGLLVLPASCGGGGSSSAPPPPGSSFHAAWFVDGENGSDGNSGKTSNKAFRSITKALSVATAGQTIQVAPGNYGETATGETFPLVIPPRVRLQGDPANQGRGPKPTRINSPAFPPTQQMGFVMLPDEQSAVVGFEIRYPHPPPANLIFGIRLEKNAVRLRDNCVSGPFTCGIELANSPGNHALLRNRVEGAEVGLGVSVETPTSVVEDNEFVGNVYGVSITSSDFDLGEGPSGGTGGNVFSCNAMADLTVAGPQQVWARYNEWDADPPKIDTSPVLTSPTDVFNPNGTTFVDLFGSTVAASACNP